MSPVFVCSVSMAVVTIYYVWRKLDADRQQQQQNLRERVAYLLWTAATNSEEEAAAL